MAENFPQIVYMRSDILLPNVYGRPHYFIELALGDRPVMAFYEREQDVECLGLEVNRFTIAIEASA
jgi:hypothetical protein